MPAEHLCLLCARRAEHLLLRERPFVSGVERRPQAHSRAVTTKTRLQATRPNSRAIRSSKPDILHSSSITRNSRATRSNNSIIHSSRDTRNSPDIHNSPDILRSNRAIRSNSLAIHRSRDIHSSSPAIHRNSNMHNGRLHTSSRRPDIRLARVATPGQCSLIKPAAAVARGCLFFSW